MVELIGAAGGGLALALLRLILPTGTVIIADGVRALILCPLEVATVAAHPVGRIHAKGILAAYVTGGMVDPPLLATPLTIRLTGGDGQVVLVP